MSDDVEQRLRAEADKHARWNQANVGQPFAAITDLLREAAAELARLREALAQAERERDELRDWLNAGPTMRLRTAERLEAAEADLAACREQEAQPLAKTLGREGIVTVFDNEGDYLGCMGIETWRTALAEAATLTEPDETGAVTPPAGGGREAASQPAVSSGSVSAEAAATKEQA